MKDVSRRFGVTLDRVEQLLGEALESGSVVLNGGSKPGSVGTLLRSGDFLSFVPKAAEPGRALGMPKIRSRIRGKDESPKRYHRLRFKFKETTPSVVKTVKPPVILTELFRPNENGRYEYVSYVSLPVEARMLDSLTLGPRTMMDMRVALGVSRRNIGSLERKGFVESFWGQKGVGRMFRITRKGSMELERLKTLSSVDRKMIERPRISMRKITSNL